MSIVNEITRLQTAKADIKAAIESKGVTVGDGTIDTYAEKVSEIETGGGYDQGYEDGKQAEYDTFWDNYQDYGNRTYYGDAFGGSGWNDTTFKPKYPITIVGTSSVHGTSVFADSNITEINVDISVDIASWQLAFASRSIRKIKKVILLRDDMVFDRTFNACISLEDITFEGVISKKISFSDSRYLSNTSIQNIIDRLADLTGGTAQTLTLHNTVGNKLTDEQKAVITAKNWTLVY